MVGLGVSHYLKAQSHCYNSDTQRAQCRKRQFLLYSSQPFPTLEHIILTMPRTLKQNTFICSYLQ